MAKCVGPGDNEKSGYDVSHEGDLWLCVDCRQHRAGNNAERNVYNENVSVLIPGDINMVVDPVLSYIVFGQQAVTQENVIKAALGHLTQEQICQAKDAL